MLKAYRVYRDFRGPPEAREGVGQSEVVHANSEKSALVIAVLQRAARLLRTYPVLQVSLSSGWDYDAHRTWAFSSVEQLALLLPTKPHDWNLNYFLSPEGAELAEAQFDFVEEA